MEVELFKTLVALVAVLGLMVGAAYLFRKYLHAGPGSRSDVLEIEVLSQRMLQPKRSLYVVKVLNKVMVLGSSENGFQPLGEIDDDQIIRSLEERQQSLREEKPSTFSEFRKKLYKAETLGEFFHKPFNVILWRGDRPGVASSVPAEHELKAAAGFEAAGSRK